MTGRVAALPWLSLPLLLLALGCESGPAKCARLQGEAAQAWGAYAQLLQRELDAARGSRDAAKHKLDGEVHQRHEAEARRQADKLYGTAKSTEWYRTFLADQQAQCSKDPECLELKVQITQLEETLTDLTARLGAVHAAERAAKGDVDASRRAAQAVPADEARAAAKTASEKNAEAIEACGK